MKDPLHRPGSLPQEQRGAGTARRLGSGLLLLVTAIGVGVALAGFISDVHSAARVAMIVVGGVILGGLIGWLLEEHEALRSSLAAEGPAGAAAGSALSSGLLFLITAIGVVVALASFIVDADSSARIAGIAVGGAILGGLIGWLWEERQTLLPRLVHGPAPSAGPLRPYLPPTQAPRSEARQAIYLKALQDIAHLRFAFPTSRYPDFKTHLNLPQRSIGVQMSDGSVAYPDIVVVQHPENYTEIVAEIETNESVGEEVARYEWLPYADLAPLYLYVPVGKGDEAQTLCRRFNIPVVGIRTWRYAVGYDEMEINDHYTAPSGPEELLPKILRRS